MANRNVKIVNKSGGKPVAKHHPKTASTAYDSNILVKLAAGVLTTSADNETVVYGVLKVGAASTDEDYATSGATRAVELIQPGDEIEIDTTASLTVGTSYGISNAYTVDQADTTNDVFTCTSVISSTRARGFFKGLAGDGVQ